MTEIYELLEKSIPIEGNYSGLYFLFDENDLVYIGKGWNCFLRVAEHTRKDSIKNFTSWNFIYIKDEIEYSKLEKELIKKYSPKYNKIHKKV